MKCATKKMRSPIKRHGGKAYLARRIVSLFPQHGTYVEPYFGGGNVLLAKPRSAREIAGDLDAGLVNFWLTLRDRDLFRSRIELTPYEECFFEKAKEHIGSPDSMVRAWAYLVINRFSRSALGKHFSWSDRPRGGQPESINAWETIKAELPTIVERIRGVEFNHSNALDLIRSHDGPGTLFYLDPPYLSETRTAKNVYLHEMGRGDHAELLEELLGVAGTFFLSGYPSLLYEQAAHLGGWHKVEFDLPNNSGQGKTKQRRIECLWSNRPISEVNAS